MSPILKGELEQKLIEAKKTLEKMYEYKTQGTILQSKTRWYNKVKKFKILFQLRKTSLQPQSYKSTLSS